MKNIPNIIAERQCDGIYNCYDGATMFYWNQAKEAMLRDCAALLRDAGYSVYQETENASIHSVTYLKNADLVHLYYLKRVEEFRLIKQEIAVPPVNPYEYKPLCSPAVTQLGLYNDPKVYTGMGYLIRLADGTFAVIDGGINLDYNADLLYRSLLEQKPDEADQIVISAWFLTHCHVDHYGVLQNFLKNHSEKVTVKMLVANDVSDAVYAATEKESRSFDCHSVIGQFGGCTLMKAHTGQKFFFPGATFSILRTHEDIYPAQMNLFNDVASTVMDATIGGKRFLWLADVEKASAPRLQEMYGEDLKCDVMQIAHHGIGYGWDDLYALCRPKVALWPAGEEVLTYRNGTRFQRSHIKYLVDTVEQMVYAAYGSHTFRFPFEESAADKQNKKENLGKAV